jgi:hypothetical protein
MTARHGFPEGSTALEWAAPRSDRQNSIKTDLPGVPKGLYFGSVMDLLLAPPILMRRSPSIMVASDSNAGA